jgi:ATP-binding protein involved in chromosome partitioning
MADDMTLKGLAIHLASQILDPASGKSILDAHLLEQVTVVDGVVTVRLQFPKDYDREHRWTLEDRVTEVLEAAEGIRQVRVQGFIEGATEGVPKPAPAAPAPKAPKAATGTATAPQSAALRGVGRVIAVASGKGGVGKSTVAVNLALALSRLGYRVGLLDVDVYGPSLPTLLGHNERPDVKDRRIQPLEVHGLRLMSLGFLMEDDAPVIWRGPIVTGIIRQFLQDVDWEGTDYLIVDMPPGTGDAQLSLAQTVPVDGAVIVTTPSDLALVDAARGLRMFQTLNVDVLGIVENMASYVWPGWKPAREALTALRATAGLPSAASASIDALERVLEEHATTWIFGQGGGRREAERLETKFLGEIPLDGAVRAGGDSGRPIVLAEPDGPVTEAFLALARSVAEARPIERADGGPKKGMFSFLRS